MTNANNRACGSIGKKKSGTFKNPSKTESWSYRKGAIVMNHLSTSELEFIVARVLENTRDCLSDEDDSPFAQGKRLAYYEVLDTIKNELAVRDVDLSGFGLEIPLETLL